MSHILRIIPKWLKYCTAPTITQLPPAEFLFADDIFIQTVVGF